MIDIDEHLRRAARTARTAGEQAIDLEADLAATASRASSLSPESRLPPPGGRAWRPLLAVAAALLVAVLAGGLVLLRGTDDEQIATVTAPDTSDVTVTTTRETTVAPAPTPTTQRAVATTTTSLAPPSTPSASVSYLSPPPQLAVRPLARMEFALPDGRESRLDVAIGDLGVVVHQPRSIVVIGFDGSRREVALDEQFFEVDEGFLASVYGPGDVLYGLRTTDSGVAMPNLEIVAVALDGEREGQVVASAPLDLNTYMELPTAALGHGPDGVVDRLRDVNRTLIGYVDENGEPLAWTDRRPPLYEVPTDDFFEGGRLTVAEVGGPSWPLEFEAAPERFGTFVGPTPPAPSSDGLGVYWTHLDNAAPGNDFDDPTTWVTAALHPDGTAEWWSVPDGWEVAASDVWGTVLARRDTAATLELALAEFGVRSDRPPPADCSGSFGPEETAARFAAAMLEARSSGDFSLIADCLDVVPDVFSGIPPFCWTPCGAERTSVVSLHTGEQLVPPDYEPGQQWHTSGVAFSYLRPDAILDVEESWTMIAEGDGYRVVGYLVEEPLVERDESLATIVEYFGHIERGDWMAAAEMMGGGGADWEERTDVQRLEPDSYSLGGVAEALERWCSAGCDSVAPSAVDLTFDGGYSLIRDGERVRVGWFEGEYFIVGVPFRA